MAACARHPWAMSERRHPNVVAGDEVPLVYLCVSAAPQKVDVVGYPDSRKVAATAGPFEKPLHRLIVRQGDGVDYWDGEPLAE